MDDRLSPTGHEAILLRMGWGTGPQWFGWAMVMGALAWAVVATERRPARRAAVPALEVAVAGLLALVVGHGLVDALVHAEWWAVGRRSAVLVLLAVVVWVTWRSHRRASLTPVAPTDPGATRPPAPRQDRTTT